MWFGDGTWSGRWMLLGIFTEEWLRLEAPPCPPCPPLPHQDPRAGAQPHIQVGFGDPSTSPAPLEAPWEAEGWVGVGAASRRGSALHALSPGSLPAASSNWGHSSPGAHEMQGDSRKGTMPPGARSSRRTRCQNALPAPGHARAHGRARVCL